MSQVVAVLESLSQKIKHENNKIKPPITTLSCSNFKASE
jgi:hypothetical protein